MDAQQKQQLQNLLLDYENLRKLDKWKNKINLFRVLGISQTEIRHSNLLAWLLDPRGNHQLGNAVLREFLRDIIVNGQVNECFELLLSNQNDFIVRREWKHIDILLISYATKTVIAIENKVNARESKTQLNRYRNILEEEFKREERWTHVYLFLTPDGDEPSDANWDILTYEDIVGDIERALQGLDLLPEVKLLIENYLDVLRREIMKDNELVDLCNEIYQKHKTALELIWDNITDSTSEEIAKELTKSLQRLENEGKIIFDKEASNKNWFVFYTKAMDSLIPDLETSNSSWNTKKSYRYWMQIIKGKENDKKIKTSLEFGRHGIDNGTYETMRAIGKFTKNKQWGRFQEEFNKYARVISLKSKNIEENEENIAEICSKYVIDSVTEYLEKEKAILQLFK
ncbi:MAG: PD-(D/E)XK nuclease family protein [Pseudomonadota bacterium]|nr:PD-(D/E)XK nuclease family protein [Pseudomonadota bacterium]